MGISDALWKVFEATGHIGAYLLYKDFSGAAEEGAAMEEQRGKLCSVSKT